MRLPSGQAVVPKAGERVGFRPVLSPTRAKKKKPAHTAKTGPLIFAPETVY